MAAIFVQFTCQFVENIFFHLFALQKKKKKKGRQTRKQIERLEAKLRN